MNALSAIKVPNPPGSFKRAEAHWKPHLDDPETAAVFAGPILTHSDWTPDNVLVSEHRAWLIDWAWPTLGAAWTDPACWVLRLMASGGHTAHDAERQASRRSGPPTRRKSTCSPPPTSGCGTRSRRRAQATGQPRWPKPRNHGLSTARLTEPSRRRARPATPVLLSASRPAGGNSQCVPSGQIDPLPAHQLAFHAVS